MSQDFTDFQTKFRVEDLLITGNDSWHWSVRPAQPTLGSGILSLKRPALHLSDITEKEAKDYSNMVKIIETTIKSTFDYNIMNYLMLMMIDKHVHYHVVPRYDGNRECANLTWKDTDWPALPTITDAQHADKNCLTIIQEKLKLNL